MKIVHYGLLEDILLPDGENLQYVPGASRPASEELSWMEELGDGHMSSEILADDESPAAVAKNMEQKSLRFKLH